MKLQPAEISSNLPLCCFKDTTTSFFILCRK